MAILYFYTEPPISMTKVQNLSEYQESFADKVAKSGYFSLFNPEIERNIREKL